jgi:hypothetical protein
MKISIYFWLGAAAAMILLQGCATAPKDHTDLAPDDARAYLEVLRSDFNAGKIRALNQVMKLTVAEADRFWPIYRQYEKDLASVGDRKLALIGEFFRHHQAGTLNDQNSKEMAGQWLQNVQDRLDLWKKYNQQISDAVSPVRGAQFLQVENQMAIFMDLNIASEMPVVGSLSPAK